MLNTDFGIINQILSVNVPWLDDPCLARFSVLMVNLWLGFPYFFLVCSGALTAIPRISRRRRSSTARRAGTPSGRWSCRCCWSPPRPCWSRRSRSTSTTTTLIQLLTGGGPFAGHGHRRRVDRPADQLHLPTAFNAADQQLGLASAIAMLIFVIVGTVSAYGFRLTRRLEEIGTMTLTHRRRTRPSATGGPIKAERMPFGAVDAARRLAARRRHHHGASGRCSRRSTWSPWRSPAATR